MTDNDSAAVARRYTGQTIVVSFAAAVGMWVLMYLTMNPAMRAPGWLAATLLAGCLFGAGLWAGRSGLSWWGGARVGLIVALINLLILGSLAGDDQPGEVIGSSLVWILGFSALAVVLASVGAAVGRMNARPTPRDNWTGPLAVVAAMATFLLIVAGGIVTALEAGEAIRGWLTANDYLLVLFPLRQMQENADVFAEHAHRLWGLLVGLTTIALVVQLWLVENRRWLRWLGVALLLAVIVQGALGGTRVIERSITLAIVHGVFGQVVFATMVAVAVVTSASFLAGSPSANEPRRLDRRISHLLVALLILQLVFGALYRHLNARPDVGSGLVHGALGGHVLNAAAVFVVAIIVGVRAIAMKVPALKRVAMGLHMLVTAQVLLGIVSLILVITRGDEVQEPVAEVLVTTAHQSVGALLLATSTAVAVWMARISANKGGNKGV